MKNPIVIFQFVWLVLFFATDAKAQSNAGCASLGWYAPETESRATQPLTGVSPSGAPGPVAVGWFREGTQDTDLSRQLESAFERALSQVAYRPVVMRDRDVLRDRAYEAAFVAQDTLMLLECIKIQGASSYVRGNVTVRGSDVSAAIVIVSLSSVIEASGNWVGETSVAHSPAVEGEFISFIRNNLLAPRFIELIPSSIILLKGDDTILKPVIRNESRNEMPWLVGNIQWESSKPGAVEVTATGLVRGRAEESATVTASLDEIEGSASVIVRPRPFDPETALVGGLFFPGFGQYHTKQPLLGMLFSGIGLVAGGYAGYYALKPDKTVRDTVYTDPYGGQYDGQYTVANYDNVSVGLGAYAAVSVIGALQSYLHARKVLGRLRQDTGRRNVSVLFEAAEATRVGLSITAFF